jgi:anti-sigma factor RsiW
MAMKTSCRDFEDRLGDILTDAMPAEDLRLAADHLDECMRCRQLLEIATGKRDLLPAGSGQSLVNEILHRTSGSGCARVREQICDFVDGILPPDDEKILAIHIKNCEACTALARALEELSATLPRMAELDPGVPFTHRVLAATSRRELLRPSGREIFADWWKSVVRRPRFAWEAAYAGTLLIALLIGNPALVSMAASAPLDEVRGKTRQVWTAAAEELTGLSEAAASGAAKAAGRLSQRVAGDPLRGRDSVARLRQKGHEWAANLSMLDSAHLNDWAAGLLQWLRDSWKSLGLDRTFS